MSSLKKDESPTVMQLNCEKYTLAIDGWRIKKTINVDAIIWVLSSWNYLLIIPIIPHIIVDKRRIIKGSIAKNISLRD